MEQSKFNILYYSNKCPFSQKVLEFIAKNGLTRELECICIDKRGLKGSSWVVQLENASLHTLPPNIDRVPALLLVKEKFQVKFGDDIIQYYKPRVAEQTETATLGNGEPLPAAQFQASPFDIQYSSA